MKKPLEFKYIAETNLELAMFVTSRNKRDLRDEYEMFIANYIFFLEQYYNIDVSDQI